MNFLLTIAIMALVKAFNAASAATVPKRVDSNLAIQVNGSSPTPMLIPYYDEVFDLEETDNSIDKRGFFTCFSTAPTPVVLSDCERVLDRIGAVQGNITVPDGLCMVWLEGTCKSRVCAKIGAFRGYNRTASSIVGELTDPILNNCIKSGSDGMTGDCPNMNGNCGTYRLYLEHHGSEQI